MLSSAFSKLFKWSLTNMAASFPHVRLCQSPAKMSIKAFKCIISQTQKGFKSVLKYSSLFPPSKSMHARLSGDCLCVVACVFLCGPWLTGSLYKVYLGSQTMSVGQAPDPPWPWTGPKACDKNICMSKSSRSSQRCHSWRNFKSFKVEK